MYFRGRKRRLTRDRWLNNATTHTLCRGNAVELLLQLPPYPRLHHSQAAVYTPLPAVQGMHLCRHQVQSSPGNPNLKHVKHLVRADAHTPHRPTYLRCHRTLFQRPAWTLSASNIGPIGPHATKSVLDASRLICMKHIQEFIGVQKDGGITEAAGGAGRYARGIGRASVRMHTCKMIDDPAQYKASNAQTSVFGPF